MQTLRIAILTHSVNPRGGVVHAMQLAEALQDLGHEVTLIAAAETGKSFFRPVGCNTILIPLPTLSGDLTNTIAQRIQAYVQHFAAPNTDTYHVYHAQDAISACALATLSERGVIAGFVRTVHHLDNFDDIRLMHWQKISFQAARQVLCVSRDWQDKLSRDYAIAALKVSNGIDAQRYTPIPQAGDDELAKMLGLTRNGPVFLAVGGIEPRKNTLRIFTAFCAVLQQQSNAQLLIVGGASLLDHSEYRQQFDAVVTASGIKNGPSQPLLITGSLSDCDMPRLFRLADALIFPSLSEGFGLVVLEAIASGTPVVVSRRPPFTEYLQAQDCVWTHPENSASIAIAMLTVIQAFPKQRLADIAQRLTAEFSWHSSAKQHLNIYQSIIKIQGSSYA
ncbi:MSMEG_0565 family glycosyltransferase [Methylomonas paludis]|uniref:MSMEG_0565 family glycosyltransferase n=1 Tax=Methylomonas paludis TaxID=1173101 RepID=A0A975ML19_9GAMM|nr:MSMEG_0565 family glycosyltransferase [Methylomonas paludis]QWF69772.1 MSMEG_0565 family glycosyltransferase [Methylomonas paludis]